jgi:HSP20 family protein
MANPIRRWDPSRETEHFRRDFDDLFDRLLGRRERSEKKTAAIEPAMESYIEGDRIVVRADSPGIDPKDVEITLTGDTLTIKGSREEKREEKDRNLVFKEVRYGSFERSIPLPAGVKVDDIKVSYKDGVLALTAPAPKELAARKVLIEVEGQKK